MNVWVKVRCPFWTTSSGGDDRTNKKSTGLSDSQVVRDLDKITSGIHLKVGESMVSVCDDPFGW